MYFYLLIILISLLYLWVSTRYKYWEKRGFVQSEPPKFPFGNMSGVGQKIHMAHVGQNIYEKFKNKAKAVGFYIFLSPSLFILDLDLIKHILIKDFDTFVNRGTYYNVKSDPLSGHMFSVHDDYWKTLRIKLTPTFTSGKMKMMFNTVLDTSQEMIDYLKKNTGEVEVKELFARFTTDVIGSVAFGLDIKSMENPNSTFRNMGRRAITFNKFEFLKILFAALNWNFTKYLPIRVFPKVVCDFFMKTVKEVIDYREKNDVKRNDFLNLMIQLKNKGKIDEEQISIGKLSMDEVTAQCFLFFLAGFETSSTAMTFCFYELARNQDVQEKLREEIKQVLEKYDGKITYEAVNEMKYLQMTLDETLRMYPPLEHLMRRCNKEYEIPDSNLVIPKDTFLWIPIYAIQRDPEIYPNPDTFDPERFTEENKKNRHPMAHLPFGDGPRNCLGLRFGLMQAKIGIVQLLTNFKFSICEKTPIPMKFHASAFTLSSEGGMSLIVEKV